ncbi:MAG: ECF transporter S component, partial [Sinomonas sp.]|nr:ECF transporter S component [Sinomonas sp.]
MSNLFGSQGSIDQTRSLPQGDVVGSYTSYLDAQKAVDYLADQQFPVELVAIVGNDLKLVERVTGRLSYPRVALNGALSGMWFGLFVGVLLSFFSSGAGYFSIITSVLMGAAFFMLFGIVTYAMQRGKRDFTSTSQVVPTSYDVVVAFEAAAEARRLLHQLPMAHSQQGWGAQPPWQQGQDQHGHEARGESRGQDQAQGQWQPPGQEPQRPSGWTDPYGVTAGQGGHEQP